MPTIFGNRVVRCATRGPNVGFDPHLPALDGVATLSEDGRTLFVAVINRNERDSLDATIDLKGWRAGRTVRAFELNGQDRDAANPFGAATNVNIRENSVPMERVPLTYRFPEHSVTVLEFRAVK